MLQFHIRVSSRMTFFRTISTASQPELRPLSARGVTPAEN